MEFHKHMGQEGWSCHSAENDWFLEEPPSNGEPRHEAKEAKEAHSILKVGQLDNGWGAGNLPNWDFGAKNRDPHKDYLICCGPWDDWDDSPRLSVVKKMESLHWLGQNKWWMQKKVIGQ